MTTHVEIDHRTFGGALAAMRQDLYRRALALTRDHSWTDDLVQATVERALCARMQFRAGSNLSAWVGTILRNIFLDACRKRRLFVSVDLRKAVAPVVESELRPWDLLEEGDLWEAASLLPPQQRLICELAYTRRLSHRDIAREMGLTVATVATRLFRARAKLRALLESRFAQRLQQRLGHASVGPVRERLNEPARATTAAPELSWPAAGTSAEVDWTRSPPSAPGP